MSLLLAALLLAPVQAPTIGVNYLERSNTPPARVRADHDVHTRAEVLAVRVVDWDAVAACEASGDWGFVGGAPFYFALQFHPDTWLAYGGTQAELVAGVAPPRQRLIEVAERVLAAQGPSAWPSCM